jgi:uncharacterized protein (DUF58 family)
MGHLAAAFVRLVRLLFPLTVRGLVIFFLAVGLLAEGVLRADLAGLFWGSSFLLFSLYALGAGHLFRLAARRSHRISIHVPASGLFPGDEGEAVAAARLPRSFPPGFSVHLSLPLAWQGRRIDGIRRRMTPGLNQATVNFPASHRGVYQGPGAVLEAHDVLGLTAHRLLVPQKDRVTVYPRVHAAPELRGLVEQSDEAALDSRRRRRSEELLEARKYYPGDDVRRLNWKVFAHTDELFLRIGEEVPPPESRILFVLDTTRTPFVPRAAEADYLDSLVESCASVMSHLVHRGLEVSLSVPGTRECRSFGTGTEPALLAALAAAAWTREEWTAELPPRMLNAVVFSSPGSAGLPRIMAAVKARGWKSSLYLQDLAPASSSALAGLRDLLLLPRERGDRRTPRAARRRERTRFDGALARDLALYHGTATG